MKDYKVVLWVLLGTSPKHEEDPGCTPEATCSKTHQMNYEGSNHELEMGFNLWKLNE